MEKKIKLFYDEEGDVLDIAIGDPKKAISEEITEDVILRLDPKTEDIIGFTIINFSSVFLKKMSKTKKPIELATSK